MASNLVAGGRGLLLDLIVMAGSAAYTLLAYLVWLWAS